MAYTIVEIISRCEDVMVNSKDCFRCHIGSCQFAGGLTFPVFMYLAKFGLSLLRNIEWIGCSGSYCVQLILQPLEGILRECLTSSWCQCAASYDQFLITDDNGNIVQDVCKSLGSSCDDRLIFCCLVGFCDQLGSG